MITSVENDIDICIQDTLSSRARLAWQLRARAKVSCIQNMWMIPCKYKKVKTEIAALKNGKGQFLGHSYQSPFFKKKGPQTFSGDVLVE